MKWYVVQTKPLSEDKVCGQFAKKTPSPLVPARRPFGGGEGWGEGGVEIFCPKIKSMSLSHGSTIKYKPLFPSYVFLRWNLDNPAKHHLVKYTRGVNKVLGDGATPVPVADEIVEVIKSRVNEGGIIEQKTFKQGDLVKVRKGHLKELFGILERPVSDSGRVAVLLQLFNRQMRVQMHCADICRA